MVGAEGPPPKSLEISAHKATSDLVFPAAEIARARRFLLADGKPFDAKKMYQLKSTIEDWYASGVPTIDRSQSDSSAQIECTWNTRPKIS